MLNDNTLAEEDNNEQQTIQVLVGSRNDSGNNYNDLPGGWKARNIKNNITIHRDNRKILASMLPTIFVTNHRSFFPKFYNFLEVIKTLGCILKFGKTVKINNIKTKLKKHWNLKVFNTYQTPGLQGREEEQPSPS